MRSGLTVVITGSTRGIGLGLARELLRRGNNVMICGRTRAGVERALTELQPLAGAAKLAGTACDVGKAADVQRLWDEAAAKLGPVDIWINNAGLANAMVRFERLPADQIENVVHANVVGTIYGSQVALRGMQAQGHGEIYNFEGFGSNGATAEGLAVYGATKRAVTYFTEALELETKGTPIKVGYLGPGIVVTDLLTGEGQMPPERWAALGDRFNVLGDTVETVTPWLAEQILANDTHGARIYWLTRGKVAWRFLTAGQRRKRDLFGVAAKQS